MGNLERLVEWGVEKMVENSGVMGQGKGRESRGVASNEGRRDERNDYCISFTFASLGVLW